MSILKKLLRLCIWLLIAVILVVAIALLVLRFSPQTALNLSNRFSPYDLYADQVNVQLLPLTLSFGGLKVVDDSQQQIADLQSVELDADWVGAIKGRQNFWNAKIADGEIDLRDFTSGSDTDEVEEEPEAESAKLDIHRLISTLSAQISNIRLIVDETSYVDLKEVSTTENQKEYFDNRAIKQRILLKFVYDLDEIPLAIDAVMESEFTDGFTNLTLNVRDLDLKGFAPAEETQSETDELASEQAPESTEAAVLDWAWMDNIEPIRFKLVVDQLQYPDALAKQLTANIKLDQNIEFDLNTMAQVKISDELSFADSVQVAGHFKPLAEQTTEADLNGEVNLKTSKLSTKLAGDFNVNGAVGNNIALQLASTAYPLISKLDTEQTGAVHSFFPVQASMQYRDAAQKITLSDLDLAMGSSDLKGALTVQFLQDGKQSISGEFNSEKVILGNAEDAEEETEEAETPESDEPLFSDEAIDWSWLDSIQADVKWQAKLLQVGKMQFTDLQLPVNLQNGVLHVKPLQTDFANGSWATSLTLSKQEDAALVEIESSLQNAVLEAMNLIPEDQISEGKTTFNTELTTQGISMQQLAAGLNGRILLDIEKGVIGNGYFELAGSDLISGLLSKLNPFVKSDPSTELKCAVVNLKAEDGKLLVDKSIVVETSKLEVVMRGSIDLGEDKLNLKIEPKAASGVGVGAGTLVKSVTLGGSLTSPSPQVTAGDLLKSGLAIGAALSTGGVSLLADGMVTRAISESACKRAKNAKFEKGSTEIEDEVEEQVEQQQKAVENSSTTTTSSQPANADSPSAESAPVESSEGSDTEQSPEQTNESQ